ncbi:sulfite exporter TauE/SafE family protein [Effusibacillus consociatus]|uniref:Sulfite exporter TauE/SafE family protein n=1 Tax=Effusibacillus consociatus TaxID=1117041 RepID=A0ABV9Q1M2_9BACL
MEQSLLSVLTLAFGLGIKHAIEPDHVIAVSTVASQTKRLRNASLSGVFWGIGHTATLFGVGMVFIRLKNEIPEKWAMSLEFLVGIMLVYLGITSLLSYNKKKIHVHVHEHGGVAHKHFHSHEQVGSHDHPHHGVSYLKSMIIGLIHGLAGSAALVLWTMSEVKSVWEGAVYILVFGAGTVIGMLLSTTMIGIPFVLSAKKTDINHVLSRIIGGVSTAFGIYYMYNLGVTEGLFNLWAL